MSLVPSRIASRVSHNGVVATVFNGAGFVAMGLLARLGKIGCQLVIAHRGSRYEEEKMRIVGDLGQVYFAKYHLKDEKSLYEAMRYSNVVVNLVGKEVPTKNFSLHEVHVDGARRMARVARECGVKKFIHFSALNCSPNPEPMGYLKNGSEFLRTKYHGELAVREEFPEAIIFRPSDILAERDSFSAHFTSLLRARYTRTLPIWDYYHGVVKQPVYLSDVISGVEAAIMESGADGRTFQAVGPYRYNFYDLIEYIRACAGQGQKYDDYDISNLRWDFLMRAAINVTNRLQKDPFLPHERIERDLHSDYVDPKVATLSDLGVKLSPLELHIASLGDKRSRHHKFEIPFEKAQLIDKPARLAFA